MTYLNHIDFGPESDLNQLCAEFIEHHGVGVVAFIDVGNEEVGGVLQLLWSDILIILNDGGIVELDVVIEDLGGLLLVHFHQNGGALVDVDGGTGDFVKISLDLFDIFLINLSLLLFLLDFNDLFSFFG